jgi:hypothetical protein
MTGGGHQSGAEWQIEGDLRPYGEQSRESWLKG